MTVTRTTTATALALFVLLISGTTNGQEVEQKQCAADGGCDGEAQERGQETPADCSLWDNTEVPGADMKVLEDVGSPEECAKNCALTSGCRSWTLGKTGQSERNCHLKSIPMTPETRSANTCCDSGTRCADPVIPEDPLKSKQKQREREMQALSVVDLLYERFREKRPTILLFAITGAVVLLGIHILGSYWHAAAFAPIKPSSPSSPEERVCAGQEKEAVLTTDSGAVLATRAASVELPLSYAPVLGSMQWDGVSRVKYSYRRVETGRSVEICADVVEREREVTSQEAAWALLTLRTNSGAKVRIDGEKAELIDPAQGKAPLPIQGGSLVCPLIHLDDRDRLGRKATELYSKKENSHEE